MHSWLIWPGLVVQRAAVMSRCPVGYATVFALRG